MTRFVFLAISLMTHPPAFAGDADVLKVEVSCNKESICDFNVTVKHADDGWEHYANRWEVRSLDGKRIGIRELTHPHDNEQPFTRSLKDVRIPDNLHEVVVRAHDSRHRYGGKEVTVKLKN